MTSTYAPQLLRPLLVCPSCEGDLDWGDLAIVCTQCDGAYDVEDSVPILLPRRTEPSADTWKSQQASYFDDAVDTEYELTRPHGAPRMYQWLMAYKFRRGTSDLSGTLRGRSALVVCAGSGMDAEFLARCGAETISLDISREAVLRSVERGRRHSLRISGVVADATQLPFRDQSVDVVYVHDGLHHLEDPHVGLREMLRVARFGISVNEPAAAFATRIAVRLGVALEVEEAGNRVGRMSPDAIAHELRAAGMSSVTAARYAMYYRHYPGRFTRLFSQTGLFPFAIASFRLANWLVGPWGNKLAVQGRRNAVDRSHSVGSGYDELATEQ